jgi:type II secretory pathway component PulC
MTTSQSNESGSSPSIAAVGLWCALVLAACGARVRPPPTPQREAAVTSRPSPPCDGHPDIRVPRSEVDALLDHPQELARMARIVPQFEGDPAKRGLGLYGLRDGVPLYDWGLRNGDSILSVNNVVPDLEHLPDVAPAVRGKPEIRVHLLRNDARRTICLEQIEATK